MIVNKPVAGKNSQTQGTDKKKQKEHDIDISALGKLKRGAAVAVDANSDAWAVTAPPPSGYYAFSPSITKDGIKGIERTEDSPESMFFKVNLELKFHSTDADIAGAVMFANVSTYIGRGKELSTVLGLMLRSNKKPKTIPSPITDVDQVLYLQKWLGAQPLVYAFVDWQVWSKNQQKTLIKGMENFPQDEDGNYLASIEVDGETCNANVKVVNFITHEEFKKIQEDLATSGEGVTESDIPEVEEEKPAAPVKQVKNTQAAPAASKVTQAVSTKQTTATGGKTVAAPAKKSVPVPAPDLTEELDDTENAVSEDDAEIDIGDFVDSDEA